MPSCAEGGVFGVLPGVIGAIQVGGGLGRECDAERELRDEE